MINGIPSDPLRRDWTAGQSTPVLAVSMVWNYSSTGLVENLVGGAGQNWAQLSILEDAPKLTFGNPVVSVQIPQDGSISKFIAVSGSQDASNLPLFVRTTRTKRRNVKRITFPADGTPVSLSQYPVLVDNLVIIDDTAGYSLQQDYTITADNKLVGLTSLFNKTVTVWFDELVPAYQCSTNKLDWTPVIVFDAARPYPDGQTSGMTIKVSDGLFPVLDEAQQPTGIFLRLLDIPDTDYLFRIDTPVSPDYGMVATLEVELEKPAFLNSLHLEPCSIFPSHLIGIVADDTAIDCALIISI